MIKSKLEKIKIIFTSEYWLVTSLCGAFFTFFALNRGGVVVFIEASFILLLINLVSGKYLPQKIPANYWVVLAICAYLLITSILFHPKISYQRWMTNLLRMLCIVFSIHCLSQKNIKTWGHPYPFDGGAMEKFVETGEPTYEDSDGYNISYMIHFPPRSVFLGLRYNFR